MALQSERVPWRLSQRHWQQDICEVVEWVVRVRTWPVFMCRILSILQWLTDGLVMSLHACSKCCVWDALSARTLRIEPSFSAHYFFQHRVMHFSLHWVVGFSRKPEPECINVLHQLSVSTTLLFASCLEAIRVAFSGKRHSPATDVLWAQWQIHSPLKFLQVQYELATTGKLEMLRGSALCRLALVFSLYSSVASNWDSES